MKKSVVVAAAALAALVGGVSIAAAAGEKTSINYSVKGKFTPKQFKPAQLAWGVGVSTDDNKILPLKRANMRFPSNKTMIFSPKRGLPACKKSATALSVSPEAAYAACGSSVVGNGEATFQLGKVNTPLNFRKGTVVILYGGKVRRNHKILFSAWSGDTKAGVFAEGVLQPNGAMNIAMPVLTADSAVTSLSLDIPGKAINGTWANGSPYSLRKGLDAGFVRVKCKRNARLTFSTAFQLGERNAISGAPAGPTTNITSRSTSRCGR